MKTKIFFLLLCFLSLNVMGQGIITRNKKPKTTQTQPTKTHRQAQGKLKTKTASKPKAEKTCDTCGKVLSKCEYNGNHPEPEAAGYDVTFTCNVPSAKLYVDGKDSGNAGDTHFLKTGSHNIKVTAEGYKDYQKSISVNRQNTSYSIALEKNPNTLNGHEWVDLGLSVKWATCNVGASSPSDYGGYYAWGETNTKSRYDLKNLKDRTSGDVYYDVMFSKYGVYDKTRLEMSDDAARQNWGGTWRMPTEAELKELCYKCKWTWTSKNGHNGYTVTGPNGNSIFLPAAGWRLDTGTDNVGEDGYYWSSTLYKSYSYLASGLRFGSVHHNTDGNYRWFGQSVRPVTE